MLLPASHLRYMVGLIADGRSLEGSLACRLLGALQIMVIRASETVLSFSSKGF
jgi:hypothetical protein